MIRQKRLSGPTPKPLSPEELSRVLAWHERMSRFYGLATALIVLGYVAAFWGSHIPWMPAALMAMLVVLFIIGAWVQFRETCPRCRAPLGRQARFSLPKECKNCGVGFEKPGRV